MIKIGDLIKVQIPGEKPWAEVINVISDTIVQARFDNNLDPFGEEKHSYKYNDVATFQYHDGWRVAPIEDSK